MLLFFNLGGGEIFIIVLFVLLFFGSKRIPEMMRGMGKGIRMFKDTIISHPENVLIGAYMGAFLDSARWRAKTEEKFGIKLHQGECLAANLTSPPALRD